ncbi:MAG: hypothetical protein FWC39_08210 [Bacteroidetes bacterium]|nr:hypothetical protein [Bacteroidota bacterium]
MLPFQGAQKNVLLFPQGVAIGLGYKWFSTIRSTKISSDRFIYNVVIYKIIYIFGNYRILNT